MPADVGERWSKEFLGRQGFHQEWAPKAALLGELSEVGVVKQSRADWWLTGSRARSVLWTHVLGVDRLDVRIQFGEALIHQLVLARLLEIAEIVKVHNVHRQSEVGRIYIAEDPQRRVGVFHHRHDKRLQQDC